MCHRNFFQIFWLLIIRKVLSYVKSERLKLFISQITKFNLTLILFAPTHCFACLNLLGVGVGKLNY